MILQIRVSESHNNWHGSFELLDKVLKLVLNWVNVERTLESLADLGVLLSELLNGGSIDLTKVTSHPDLSHGAPLFERVPHQVTVNELSAALFKVIEVGGGHIQLVLPIVVAVASFLKLFKGN
jgi:hypothetical protein